MLIETISSRPLGSVTPRLTAFVSGHRRRGALGGDGRADPQPEKLTGHTTSSIIVISGPCLAGVRGRSGHSRASRRPRARLRAISLRQADTDWFVVATKRAAVRQR